MNLCDAYTPRKAALAIHSNLDHSFLQLALLAAAPRRGGMEARAIRPVALADRAAPACDAACADAVPIIARRVAAPAGSPP